MIPLSAETLATYVNHAFAAMNRVLDRVDDDTVNVTPDPWGTNSIAGLVTHCCELAPSWFATPGLGRETTRDRDAEFTTQATVAELRERVAASHTATLALAREFADAPATATDHPLREFLPASDRSDAALAIHVLEELFWHLGHMEVTADALGR